MARDGAARPRVVYPIKRDEKRKLAALRAASVRVATRKMFPDDDRYFEAFRRVRPGDIAAAFQGGRVCGVLLVQRRGRDVYNIDPKQFQRLYGPVRGRILHFRYFWSHRFTQAGDFYLASIWVKEAMRSSGLGGRLLDAVTSARGGRWTVLARNEAAARFFASHGFQRRRDPHGLLLALLTRRIPMEWNGRPLKRKR